jgi:hypothetical protein
MDFRMMARNVCRLGIAAALAAPAAIALAQAPGAPTPAMGCKGAYTATQWSTTSTVMPDGSVKVITAQNDLAQSSSGQLRMTAHAWSDGSERKAQPITRVQILDWGNHRFTMLFPDSHLATRVALPALHASDPASIPKSIKTDLGRKTMDGIAVTGERNVFTIMEPSAKGSPREVTFTTEFWSNRKMCLTMKVLSRDSNNGTAITEMTNVATAEPAAALFDIPAGYKMSQ